MESKDNGEIAEMTRSSITTFCNLVLSLHPSRSSSRELSPRVSLKRLSSKTIKKYTGNIRLCKSSHDERRSSYEPTWAELQSPTYSSDEDNSEDLTSSQRLLQINQNGKENTLDNDMKDDDSSDELPDLNDPSLGIELKKREKTVQKKNSGKLMETARKAFQDHALRFKSSQEFIKASKEIPLREVETTPTGISHTYDDQFESSNEILPNIAVDLTSDENTEDMQTMEREINNDVSQLSPSRSESNLMTLSEEKVQGELTSTHVSVTDYDVRTHNSVDTQENNLGSDENSQHSHVSGDSDLTVLFGDDEEKFCPLDFTADAIRESTTFSKKDLSSATTLSHSTTSDSQENLSSKEKGSGVNKRKGIPEEEWGLHNNVKRLREVRKYADKDITQPMVKIPISINNSVSLATLSTTVSNVAHPERKIEVEDNTERNGQNEYCIGNEYIVIVDDTSQENVNNTNETLPIIASYRSEKDKETPEKDNIQGEIPDGVNEKEKETIEQEINKDVKQGEDSFSKNPFASLRQLSIKLQEITMERFNCEKRIRDVREEYNKKLETLEEEKKNLDVEINKMILAMREFKDVSEDQLPRASQSSTSDATSTPLATAPEENDSMRRENTQIEKDQNTASMATPTTNTKNKEKRLINIIPAANIKNFGNKKSPLKKDVQVKDLVPITPKPNLVMLAPNPGNKLPEVSSQAAVTSLPLSSGSIETNSLLTNQMPPNAIVIPGLDAPVISSSSSHIMCHTLSLSNTQHIAQNRPVPSSHLVVTPVSTSSESPSIVLSENVNLVQNLDNSQNQQTLNEPLQIRLKCFVPQKEYQQQDQSHQRQQQVLLQVQQNQSLPQQQEQQQMVLQKQSSNNIHIHRPQIATKTYGQQCKPPQNSMNKVVIQGGSVMSIGNNTPRMNINTMNSAPHFAIGGGQTITTATVPTMISGTHNIVQRPNATVPTMISDTHNIVQRPNITSHINKNYISHMFAPMRFIAHSQSSSAIVNNVNSVPPPSSHVVGALSQTNPTEVVVRANTQAITSSHSTPSVTPESSSTVHEARRSNSPQEETEFINPVCTKCGSAGIFKCCENIVYCSTTCQGNDWEFHRAKCTNSA